jgi:glutathione S-transferase
MYKLLSATPSPYARKVRILLHEKAIPFDLVTEVPWNRDARAPSHNPLGKIPVLILPDGNSVYESSLICDWLSAHHPTPSLGLETAPDRLDMRRYEVLADGICDALVLMFLENQRAKSMRSQAWFDRQNGKVSRGLAALETMVADGPFANGPEFSFADIACGAALGYLALRWPDHPWRVHHPRLAALSQRLEQRPSFRETQPSAQTLRDKVV